ncbi:MAG: DUF4954 family protein, partial [Fibrobacteres bacterium]|nr:DUF4954 family protein [Fibrobacterota bacterium]
GTHISNYSIESGAAVLNVAELTSSPDTTFGQGTMVEALNEAGGRDVPLSTHLTSQMAYLISVYKYRPKISEKLVELLKAEWDKLKGQKGMVKANARVMNSGAIRNVCIGTSAVISGAAQLTNGAVRSCSEDPAIVGDGVSADSFVILEGAHVTGHAILNKSFVGQGARIGKQFSAENSLFFANAEGFHGEACSIFAGPYSVTHHKSTLLIAAMYSFYNAGSGTNHSNHMYKLGPVHQGVLERGCKTGSFSYLLLEAHLAPFCIVIGKHMANLNIPDMPFSYISESGGKSHLTPAMNVITIGTIRDQEKWASRDRRKTKRIADIINPAVYSPYTVEKMVRGRDFLMKLYNETPKDVETLNVGGALLARLLTKNSAKYYDMTITRYLANLFFTKVGAELKTGKSWSEAVKAVKPSVKGEAEWVDLSGLLAPKSAAAAVLDSLEAGKYKSAAEFSDALTKLNAAYSENEWAYAYMRFATEAGVEMDALTQEKALSVLEEWKTVSRKILNMTLADAEKEFEDFAKISYGIDGTPADAEADFKAVRGEKETNKVLVKLKSFVNGFMTEIDAISELVKNVKK